MAVANPPYIQLQRDGGKLGQLYKDTGFDTYVRSGDIYQLFYERGCQVLRPNRGLLAYITSNSWLKAEYGKSTRRYFSESHTPLRLLELGKDVFDSAIVDSGVLLLRTGDRNGAFPAVDMDRLPNRQLPSRRRVSGGRCARPGKRRGAFCLEWNRVSWTRCIARGTPLRDWDVKHLSTASLQVSTMRSSLTMRLAKMVLVAKDPNSAAIIKPILRGRDIQRYQANWAGKWLITTFTVGRRIGIDDYPAVEKDDLLSFAVKDRPGTGWREIASTGGRSRKKTKHSWNSSVQDLRHCAYLSGVLQREAVLDGYCRLRVAGSPTDR